MGRAFTRFTVLAVVGLLIWAIFEPQFPKTGGAALGSSEAWERVESAFFFTIYLVIGAVGGLLIGLERGSRRHALVGLALGVLFGLVAVGFANTVGGAVFETLMRGAQSVNPLAQPNSFIRGVTFAIFGLFMGLGIGGTRLNLRHAISGALGGLVGGGIAGVLFDPISTALSAPQMLAAGAGQSVELGAPGRAILSSLLPGAVGLFTALAEYFSRKAWVRLELARNEGRTWAIDGNQTNIGRDERADIPLFGDPSVAPFHAQILRQSGQFVLLDAGSPLGIGHNGVRVPQAVLQHGDTFNIGTYTLRFLTRGQAPVPAAANPSAPVPSGPIQPIQQTATQSVQPVASSHPTQAFSAPQTPGFALRLTAGPRAGERILLTARIEVGRESSGIALPGDANASRRHAALTPTPAGLFIEDLGSTNGTLLNGQRVTTATAQVGDEISIGNSRFRVEGA